MSVKNLESFKLKFSLTKSFKFKVLFHSIILILILLNFSNNKSTNPFEVMADDKLFEDEFDTNFNSSREYILKIKRASNSNTFKDQREGYVYFKNLVSSFFTLLLVLL